LAQSSWKVKKEVSHERKEKKKNKNVRRVESKDHKAQASLDWKKIAGRY